MTKTYNMVSLYNDVIENDKMLSIKLKRDVPMLDILLNYPFIAGENRFEDLIIEEGTSLFIDKIEKNMVIKRKDKSMVLIDGKSILEVDFSSNGYTYFDGENEYNSCDMTPHDKHEVFDSITEFLDNFENLYQYLPIDSNKTFICLNMGIITKDSISTVACGEKVILYLNSFRNLNYSKLKLNIADSYTYELIGSIDVSLRKSDESNFSYQGNVSYKIDESFESKGYATDALKTLVEYVDTIDDEYNKELYVAALVEDIAYKKVAEKNGGVLVFEGDVPHRESLAVINKVKQIKIYKLRDK